MSTNIQTIDSHGKNRKDGETRMHPNDRRGGVKYVRTMLVMRTPYTQQSKACVWCCYHGGHATTLSCHMNVCVHGHSRPYFDVTCVASHRMSLRQSALRAPQPHFERAQSSPFQANPIARARSSQGNNLLLTLLAQTHWTGRSALHVGEEKEQIASHQQCDLLSRA